MDLQPSLIREPVPKVISPHQLMANDINHFFHTYPHLHQAFHCQQQKTLLLSIQNNNMLQYDPIPLILRQFNTASSPPNSTHTLAQTIK